MIEVTIKLATTDDLLTLAQTLSGVNGATLVGAANNAAEVVAKPKKETPAAKAAAATTAAFTEEKPTKGKGKKGKSAPSIDELKAHILSHAGEGADQPEKIKEYVRTFGVIKISDMTEAQRQEAFDGAEAYFAEEEEEEDPMA
jgi:hypothetical protein